MKYLDLLMLLRRFRFFYFAVFIAAFIICVDLMIPWVLKYEGESTFYLANEGLINPSVFSQKGQQDILQVNLVQERVNQLAFSTEMMTFLIGRFNLYSHYGIDTLNPYYFTETVRNLTKNIRFNKLTTDLASVTVTDRNNEIAAAMANALVWKLDQLNKKYLIDKIQSNLNFYDSYLKESNQISREQNKVLSEYMEALNHKRQTSSGTDQYHKPLSEIEFSLYQAAAKIEDVTTQLMTAKSLYTNALSSSQTKNLPSLVIVKRALPDLLSKKYLLLLFAFLGALLSTTLLIIIMVTIITYQTDIGVVLGRKIPDTKSIEDRS